MPYVPPPGFWQAVRAACDRHGALLIMDEIPTGLGKTGAMFAFEHVGIVPDIVTLGKALGGDSLPIAACIACADLNVCGDFAIGHCTDEKNPVTAPRNWVGLPWLSWLNSLPMWPWSAISVAGG